MALETEIEQVYDVSGWAVLSSTTQTRGNVRPAISWSPKTNVLRFNRPACDLVELGQSYQFRASPSGVSFALVPVQSGTSNSHPVRGSQGRYTLYGARAITEHIEGGSGASLQFPLSRHGPLGVLVATLPEGVFIGVSGSA